MTTAIHIIMQSHSPYAYDSYDPVHSYTVNSDTLNIIGSGGTKYTVNLSDVAFWEYVEGADVNTREYFEAWKERNGSKRPIATGDDIAQAEGTANG